MSKSLQDLAISSFFEFYKSDLDSESLDDNNVVLSFPIHISGLHRIEVIVTQIQTNQFVISDGAKTIEELKNAGYVAGSKLQKRLELISRIAKIRVVNEYLVTESDTRSLGSSIQRFVEAVKTIGDAYLVQRAVPPKDVNLIRTVSEFLAAQSIPYQPRRAVKGRIEKHQVDFLFPPNGVPGLALSIMGNPTRIAAEAWHFKTSDIKAQDPRMRVGVVYEAELASEASKAILNSSVDIPVPSSEMSVLTQNMRSLGILKAS